MDVQTFKCLVIHFKHGVERLSFVYPVARQNEIDVIVSEIRQLKDSAYRTEMYELSIGDERLLHLFDPKQIVRIEIKEYVRMSA